jgi:hypothetical protein
MSRECVVPSETVATHARVRFDTSMYLGVALEIVLSNETLMACWALELSVVEMGLDM